MTRSFFAAGFVSLLAASAAPAQTPQPDFGPPVAGCEAECGGRWSGGCFGKFSRWLCFRQTPNFFGLKPTPFYPPLYTWFPTKECGHAGCGVAGCGPKFVVPAAGPAGAPVSAPVAPAYTPPPPVRTQTAAPAPTLPPPPMTSLQTGRAGYPAVVPAGFRLPARSSVTPIPANGAAGLR